MPWSNEEKPAGMQSRGKEETPLSQINGNDIQKTPLVSSFAGCIKKAKIIGVKCLLSVIFIIFEK